MIDICSATELNTYENKVHFYIELKQTIGNKSGDFLDFKAYEPDMRKLIDNYIVASDSIKIGEFDDLTLLDFVVDQGETMTDDETPSGQKEGAAEAIENNIRRKMVEKVTVNPKYYEKMSAILDKLIQDRQQGVVFNVTKDIRMTDIPTWKQKLEQQYINLAFDPAAALSDLRLNSFTKKYIKNILARITGYIEEQTDVASNYCNYMNTQTKNPFEIEHIITDHYEWFTAEYSDQDDFRRWRNSIGALLLLHKSINASLNDAKYDYKLKKYCSNEGNIYTESLGELAYQNNPKFKKFIADNSLGFKAYASFGKNEITERIAVLVDLVKLVWNDDMFI